MAIGVLFSVAAFSCLVIVGQLIQRRRHRRMAAEIVSYGGKVVAFKSVVKDQTFRNVIDYIGPDGELRRAELLYGAKRLSNNRPYQQVLKEQFETSRGNQMLRGLRLAAACFDLPGNAEYISMIRELATGSVGSVIVEESPANHDAGRRFAPILQCLEAAGIADEPNAGQDLALVVDGKINVVVRWSATGETPRRRLIVTVVEDQSLAG
jgi:hypothetical protein